MENVTKIDIFRPGRHTTAAGEDISFSDEDVSAIATGYDPDLHQAPLVIGHPKSDDPAFGWVKGVEFNDGTLVANAVDVDPSFAEVVNKGRFKKVSASFYKPDAGGNPKPGSWYLRHIGFLGAAAPAVKGLKAVSFAEDGDDIVTVEFGEQGAAVRDMDVARLFRRLREFIIDKFDLPTADETLPEHSIDFIKDTARDDLVASGGQSAFSEPSGSHQPKETKTMPDENKAAELEARSGELDTRDSDLKTREGDQEKREAEFAERQQQLKETEIGTFLDGIIKDGKLAPGKRDGLVQFMASLDDSDTVQFAEKGDEETSLAFFKGLLNEGGKVVDFSEASEDDGRALSGDASGTDIAKAGAEFQESEKAAGRTVDAATAVAHIRNQGTSK